MWSCGVLRLSFAYKKHCSSSAHFQACECCCGFGVGLSTLNRMDYQRAWTWICWNDWITLVRTKCITSCVIVLGVMRPSRCVLSKKWLSLSMTSDEEQHECVGMLGGEVLSYVTTNLSTAQHSYKHTLSHTHTHNYRLPHPHLKWNPFIRHLFSVMVSCRNGR